MASIYNVNLCCNQGQVGFCSAHAHYGCQQATAQGSTSNSQWKGPNRSPHTTTGLWCDPKPASSSVSHFWGDVPNNRQRSASSDVKRPWQHPRTRVPNTNVNTTVHFQSQPSSRPTFIPHFAAANHQSQQMTPMMMENYVWPVVGAWVGLSEKMRYFKKGSSSWDKSSRSRADFSYIVFQSFLS